MLVQGVPFGQIDWPLAYDEAVERLHSLSSRLAIHPAIQPSSFPTIQPSGHPTWSTFTQEGYEKAVRLAKEYIAAGDIYQANLSQRISADLASRSPLALYETLRSINPSPFAAYLETEHCALVSSSPERLIRLEGNRAETRPIAGTRPRGASAEEDSALAEELLLHPKERAEHLMLVDLERNDLGRVCSYGTVRVDELMVLEAYSHVRHIVSNVAGTLHPSKDRFDLMRAVFPGGTITGVPKIRCMEIIEELEPVRRGPYTGSMGYLSFSGEMDLNILIRTFVVKDGIAHIQVGAGIVADSDPPREYEETLHKARALLEALSR
jgi:aminodeoxychorismate synthase component I